MNDPDQAIATKLPCSDCGSSDAKAEYPDGHTFCFSCEAHKGGHATTLTSSSVRHYGDFIPLRSRKLSPETLKKYGYRIRPDTQVHAAPYYDQNNTLVAVHTRGPDKDFRWEGKMRGVKLFGQHIQQDKGKRVVVTEGEIDAMSISQAFGNKWPVVSIPSGSKSAVKSVRDNLEWLNGFDEVVLAFDGDEPGKRAVEDVAVMLKPGQVRHVVWPTDLKDASDVLVDKGPEVLRGLIQFEAQEWRPDGIVSGEALWDHVVDFWDRPESKIQLPWFGLTEKTHGLRGGELWVWTAGTGVGKSTATNEVVFKSLKDDPSVTWGVVALEEGVGQTITRYLSLASDRPFHLDREGVSAEDLRPLFDKYVKGRIHFYDHFGSVACDALVSKIRYLACGLGVDYILLDHISIAVSAIDNEDERKAIDGLVTELRSIAEQTGVGIHIVSHLRRIGKSDRGHEEGDRVRLSHLRGSGSIAQLADMVVALERDKQDPSSPTVCRVLKNRYSGQEGVACKLKYDTETGRLLDSGEELHELEDY